MTSHEILEPDTERTPVTIFEYQRVSSWAEAVEHLSRWDGDARIIAGGQSLVPMVTLRLAAPAALIDVNAIEARPPFVENGFLTLDAMTRYKTLVSSDIVRTHAPLLAHATRFIGNVRVRNRGTLGGSLAHAEPTAEIGAVLLALEAEVVTLGPSGERTILIDDFLVSYLTTALEQDEVVTGARIPIAGNERWAFHEVVGRYADFATVSVTVVAKATDGGTSDLRVVLGGVADRPVLVDAELLRPVREAAKDARLINEAAQAIAASIDPNTDLHASASYRRTLVAVHTRRLLERVLGHEGGVA